MAPSDTRALLLEGISKSYPGVLALDRVSLSLEPGEVHGLAGENGAGKSTLMSVASGATRPDSGSVAINGTPLGDGSPRRARELGLALVHQRPALPPDLTVLESFLLVHPALRPDRPGHEWVRSWLEPWGSLATFRPRSLIEGLAPMQRFVVEIARALATEPSVLLLDEPTEHLDQDGAEVLFDYIARLSAAGCSIVYISHRIREMRRLADRITVLRDGRERGTFATGDISEAELVDQIAGRSGVATFPPKGTEVAAAPVLSLEDYETSAVSPLTLDVPPGQIVGLAGVEGNGQRELLRSLAGLARSRGRCAVDGRPVRSHDVAAATAAGLCLIPGDRHGEGILGGLSARENISLMTLRANARMGFISATAERARAEAQIARFDIKAPSAGAAVDSLSGGNQQKVVLSRVLLAEPRVVLADEPTQGVDVAARADLYAILRQIADSGSAVVVVSKDAAELAGLCDRVLVLSRGTVVADLAGAEVTEKAITHAAVTATGHRGAGGRAGGPRFLARLLRSPAGPPAVLLAAMVALGGYTATQSDTFLTSLNLTDLMVLSAVLAFFSLAQQLVILSGGIDLSVGALGGLLVVIASFWMTDGATPSEMTIGFAAMVGVALVIGLLNWSLVDHVGLPAIAATLVTLMGLQGVSLVLRPSPEGVIDPGLIDAVLTQVGAVPVVFAIAVVLGVAFEVASRRSRWGVSVRAIGSDSADARQLGVRDRRVRMTVYTGATLLVFLGAVALMTQVGVGDPNSGVSFTLPSIAAVVLGGTSIFGGRGSFIGALAGAVMIEEITNATVFLNLDPAWQLYLVGGILIAAAALYSRGGRGRSQADAAA